MRIFAFAEMWDKLQNDEIPTWRLPRKDAPKGRDWHEGECVQCWYRPRSPKRKFLFNAQIIRKQKREIVSITEDEARADGFPTRVSMWLWLQKTHPGVKGDAIINKLTLKKLPQEG